MSRVCDPSSLNSISQEECGPGLKGACQSSNENLRFGEIEVSLERSDWWSSVVW
jgi:hypothetical protein